MIIESSTAAVYGGSMSSAVSCIVYTTPGCSVAGSSTRSRYWRCCSPSTSASAIVPSSTRTATMLFQKKPIGGAKPVSHGGARASASMTTRAVPRASSSDGDVIVTVGVGEADRATVTVVEYEAPRKLVIVREKWKVEPALVSSSTTSSDACGASCACSA